MSNSKLYQPPPPPPRPKGVARDPLVALSRAPAVSLGVSPVAPQPVEELTDLTDDEGLEEWAKGGTRIMAKPLSQREPQAATQMQTPAPVAPTMSMPPQPSYYPVSMSAPPPPVKRSSAGIWIAAAGALVLVLGGIAAAAGIYVYHAREAAAAALAVPDVMPTVTATATATDAPTVTLAPTTTATTTAPKTPATATLTITNTSSVKRAAPSTTSTTTATTSPTSSSSASSGSGSIRTFAAGVGKPVYVDGKQVGVGGGKIATVCGHHSVAVGTGHAKTVEIPCNGSTITVGTPDGT